MTKGWRQDAARLLADAWLAGATIDFPAKLLPEDRAGAYAIQDEMARQAAAADSANAVVGWKVGATSAGVQKAEGYDGPIPGRIFASTVYSSGAELPASRSPHATIEAEIAFRFEEVPWREDGPFSWAGLAGSAALLPAFDITSTRYSPRFRAGWTGRQEMLAGIADNGNGGAVVLGAPVSGWQSLDFVQVAPALRVNCGDRAPTLWDDDRGDPRDALVWTVNHVYARGFTVTAGDVVLTGSLIQPQPLQAGDSAVCRFPELGQTIACQISRA